MGALGTADVFSGLPNRRVNMTTLGAANPSR